MSDQTDAQSTFLSWMRRGAAAGLTNADTIDGSLPFRGQINASVTLTASFVGSDLKSQPPPIAVPIELYGPGDVIGIDPRHIIHTEPAHLTANFEPNYFAGIEFDHPDFPWLFTPAAPKAGQLRPWLSLIVLAPGEYVESAQAANPLPSITVANTSNLPDLGESFAWAHAQVAGGSVQDISGNPGIALSRLLCPRHLQPDTAYTAFLVPAFDLGVLAGLGQPVPSDPTTQIHPAWTRQPGASISLPVYYRFEFHTSNKGDFEALARQLRPVMLPMDVGVRLMDVDHVGWDSVPGAGDPLDMGGALFAPQSQEQKRGQDAGPQWVDPGKMDFQNKLEELLNLTDQDDDPKNPKKDSEVVPPFYGHWHAAVQQLTSSAPVWLSQLNLDPRNRAAAGLGTQIIHKELTQLLASAWNQLGSIEKANQKLRQAQMGRSALVQLHVQHFNAAPMDTQFFLTTAVHSRIQLPNVTTHVATRRNASSPSLTIRATITLSRLPQRALSAPFRSIIAPRRQLRVRQLLAAPPFQIETPVQEALSILTRLNTGEIGPIPKPQVPREDGLVPLDSISPNALTFGAITPGAFSDASPHPAFSILAPGTFPYPSFPSTARGVRVPGDSPDAAIFRTAATGAAQRLQTQQHDPDMPPPADLQGLQGIIMDSLDPETTVVTRLAQLISITVPTSTPVVPPPPTVTPTTIVIPPPSITPTTIVIPPSLKAHPGSLIPHDTKQLVPTDQLNQIMLAPDFPQPMYEPLRDLSQDCLLPGVQNVGPNTVGLLRPDHAFIEAYMVGLNHEMARQLLWNGFPTDQRGSYFRQFWDVRSHVPTPDEIQKHETPEQIREKLKDIPPITPDNWPSKNMLGENVNPLSDNVKDSLVLVVRGELLRRYPHAIIYACQATLVNGKRTLGSEEMHILFRGTFSPDLVFFGFNLTAQTALGTPGSSDPNQQGWYFVFQQQPGAPRFGLEDPPKGPPSDPSDPYPLSTINSWNDLSWANFASNKQDLDKLQFAPIKKQPKAVNITNTSDSNNIWGTNAAQTAYITYRPPARVAIHAETMLSH